MQHLNSSRQHLRKMNPCLPPKTWGIPEIIIEWPEEELTIKALYEMVADYLNDAPSGVEELLHRLCHCPNSIAVDSVEGAALGQYRVYAMEVGHHDIWASTLLEVLLDSTMSADGIHVFMSEEPVIYEEPTGPVLAPEFR